ncbi:MAG TPA: acyltransferase [Candidatus Nanopelagicales bacterium]
MEPVGANRAMVGRDRFVDLLRGGSIVAVVLGHWLVADVRWDGALLTDTSTLAEVPSMWPITWLFLVIPLFFFVGGYANRRSWQGARRRGEGYAAYLDRRLHRLLTPTALYLAVVCAVGVVVAARDGLGLGQLGGLVLQSLWFLGAYLWVVALAPVMLAAHERWGAGVLAVLAVLIVLGDLGRFGLGLSIMGYLNVLWVWLLMHQLGFWYGQGRWTVRQARWMLGVGLVATAALTSTAWYPTTMVAVPGISEGNMHPPTLAVTTLGVAQIGACLLLRPLLVRWLDRPRVWRAVVAVNLTIISIYCWHQAALLLAARLTLPLGWPDPVPGTAAWWVAHVTWLLVPAVVLAAIVAAVGRVEQVRPPIPIRAGRRTASLAALAVIVVGIGFIDLAGSSALSLLAPGEQLGPFTASAALGLALLAAGAGLMAGMRRWAPADDGQRVLRGTAAGTSAGTAAGTPG